MNFPKHVQFLRYSAIAIMAVSLWSCKDEPPTNGPNNNNNNNQIPWDQATADVLCDITNKTIIPFASDFDKTVGDLVTAVKALEQQKNQATLDAAKQSWRDARRPWEMFEAALFGPAKNQQIDPAVDSWPLDLITLDSMLHSSDQFTKEYFDQSEGTVKGAHAVEYLLWGEHGDKKVEDITAREFEFMLAVMESYRGSTERLLKAWNAKSAGGEGYGEQLCGAGKPGSLYGSQASGIREIINGLVTILVEVSDAKMGIPYFHQNNEFEEARFSNNSIADFVANIEGVQSIYLGTYGSNSGKGLTDLVKAKDAALDTRVKQEIIDAMNAINNIKPTFGEAVVSNRNSVQTARAAVTKLAGTFNKEVTELLLPTAQ